MAEFEPGTTIDGRYRVLSRVGAGGMADVYLAEDEQLGRQVALKLLHRRFAEDPGFVERFRREAQAAASLQHPNVVSVFDRGSFGGTYYIAMEYLEGRSLKQLIREEAPLAPERTIDLTEQILKAARFAHRRGVIHRDLKPHNVIVDSSDHAKVTDFGIARAGASDMTETGSIMGTAQYLSPEQAQGHAVSAPSDLYSVGVILYEMLTARVPFDGESPVTIALKHVSEAPIPPSQLNPAVPPALEQVVLWAMNKNPADRPADADQFIAALEQVRASLVGGNTASMRAIGAAGVGGAAIEAAGVAAAQTAPPTTVMPPAGAVAAYGAPQTLNGDRFDHYDDEPPDDGRRWWPWLLALLVLLLIAGGVLAYLLTRPTKVEVPCVTNMPQNLAVQTLENRGLTPSPVLVTNSAKAHTVVGQSPGCRAEVNSGTTVDLNVSAGPGKVTIPSVVGTSRKDAIASLKSHGLKVKRIVSETSTTIPKGDAASTDPSAGTSVPRGTGVTLFLSTGKPVHHTNRFRVPYVVGEPLAQAEQTLGKHFTVVARPQSTSAVSPNTVMTQTPQSGTLTRGSTVALTYAQAPTKVPAVDGDTATAAVRALTGAGYGVRRSYRLVTNPSQNGIVLQQTPAGNSTAKKGTTVTIVIGKYVAPTTTSTPPPTTSTPNSTTTTP